MVPECRSGGVGDVGSELVHPLELSVEGAPCGQHARVGVEQEGGGGRVDVVAYGIEMKLKAEPSLNNTIMKSMLGRG